MSCDAVNVQGVTPSTPHPSSTVAIDKSLLVCSPVRSSDVTRVLQQRRQERKEMLSSSQSSSRVSKDKKKGGKR